MWNVGSFFRTADALGVSHLYLTGYTAAPPRKEITKTAIGAEEWVAWSRHDDPLAVIEDLKAKDFTIVALERTPDAISLTSFRRRDKMCLIVGHEIAGVPQSLLDAADEIVAIPMRGKKESLNVSVALGIALYALASD